MAKTRAAGGVHVRSRGPKVVSSPDELTLVYGFEGDVSEVSVFELAPALQSFGYLVREATKTVYPECPDFEIRVRPFRDGSFLSDLVMTSPAWGPVLAKAGHTQLHFLGEVLKDLGIVKAVGNGLLKVMEILKGPPKTIQKLPNGNYRVGRDNNSIEVNGNVGTLIQNPTIHQHFYDAIAKPIEHGVTKTVSMRPKGLPKRQAVRVNKEKALAIKQFTRKSPPVMVQEATGGDTQYDIYVHPKRGSFDSEGKNWSFRRGKDVFTANIKDQKFLKAYSEGKYRLNHTDLLKVHVVERQRVKSGLLHTVTEITEVLEYHQGPKQPKLDPESE